MHAYVYNRIMYSYTYKCMYDSYSFVVALQLYSTQHWYSNLNGKINIISVHVYFTYHLTLVNQCKVLAHPSDT